MNQSGSSYASYAALNNEQQKAAKIIDSHIIICEHYLVCTKYLVAIKNIYSYYEWEII